MASPPTIDVEDTRRYVRPQLSIYLACSLTSVENRTFKDEVLAKVARIFAEAGFKVHNPSLHTPPGSPHSPTEVYFEDLFRTIGADFIFFLRLGRSHGMGIEAQLAADVLLPWADARVNDDSYKLSPLLAGLANAPAEFRATVAAGSPREFYGQLAQFLRDQGRLDRLAAVHHARDAVHALIRGMRLGFHVRVRRLVFGLCATDLSELTDIDPTWIEAIESDPRFVSKLSLLQVARLCDALEIRFGPSRKHGTPSLPEPKTPGTFGPALFDAAQTFADYSLGSGSPSTRRPMDDASLLSQWQSFLATRSLGVAERRPEQLPSANGPIRVFLCHPLSNVLPIEKKELDSLVGEITNAVKNSGIEVDIETPRLQSAGRQDHGPEIYLGRVAGLRHTDLAIVFLDPASTGVGIMLQLIHNATIPCLCLTKNWTEVSRMVRGLAPAKLPFIQYSSIGTVGPQIADWLTQHSEGIRQSREHRDRAWLRLAGLDVRRVFALAGIVGADVPSMSLFREEFVDRLKGSDDLTGALTLFQMAYIAIAQQWQLVSSSSGFLAFEPPVVLPTGIHNREIAEVAARTSLSNLWDAIHQIHADESNAVKAWSTYLQELSPNAARKAAKVKTVADLTWSTKDWLRVLGAKDEL